MSHIFLSYRYTGEDHVKLKKILEKIEGELRKQGHEVFCSFLLEGDFSRRGFSLEEIYQYCLEEQKKCDTFLAFVKSPDPSTGMQRESELAVKLEQRYLLAIQKNLAFMDFRKHAEKTIEWKTLEELYVRLKEFDK